MAQKKYIFKLLINRYMDLEAVPLIILIMILTISVILFFEVR